VTDYLPTLTLWQPWASLVMLGVKTIETRAWPAPAGLIGQRIGIHAARRIARLGEAREAWDALPSGVYEATRSTENPTRFPPDGQIVDPLPLGVLLGTARLTACVPMVAADDFTTGGPHLMIGTSGYPERLLLHRPSPLHYGGGAEIVTDQAPFGDFAPGRFAWLLDDIAPTTERCPACDGQCGSVTAGQCIDIDGNWWHDPWKPSCPGCSPCTVCHGEGRCEPIPATGRQRIWHWTPEETPDGK